MRFPLDVLTYPLTPAQYFRSSLTGKPPRSTSTTEATVISTAPNGVGATTIRLRPDNPLHTHRAGQFITLALEINGVRQQRCYSITSAPAPATSPTDSRSLELTVGRSGRGSVSDYISDTLAVGDRVLLGEPQGTFHLPTQLPPRLLLLSAGTGITPIMSMLRTLSELASPCAVTHIHFRRTADHQIFASECARLGQLPWLDQHLINTENDPASHLSTSLLDQHLPNWRSTPTFACGPAGLLDVAMESFESAGSLENLHLEQFTPMGLQHEPDPSTATNVTVHLADSGRQFSTTSETLLLDAAEAAGIAIPNGCRTGVCHTCTTRLASGCSTNLRTGRVAEQGEHIQLCVSIATTSVTLNR